MDKKNENFKHHLFICTNIRADGTGCGIHKSQELVGDLKKWIKEEKLSEVKVTRSGCLSKCEEAIVMCDYPSGEWSTFVESSDIDLIKKTLKESE